MRPYNDHAKFEDTGIKLTYIIFDVDNSGSRIVIYILDKFMLD